ncbi:esterase-like activity of phytase family protein [Nocardioides xinjiangensis]|uniref:esterase-like activity of phytase family protein n=1 Tax=Nocardioides xinjiangensis TaxID=2817376 RepID=UPI001FF03272|nr:esterase-like activity of phytase family protein [Nocardioides sp. SYSU D00514]
MPLPRRTALATVAALVSPLLTLPLLGAPGHADRPTDRSTDRPSGRPAERPADQAAGRWVDVPTLVGRATLDADFLAPGPPSGTRMTPANGRSGPFPGQVVPGFSAMLDNGDGTFWAMPDNGFGTKANSADFLLRMYEARPDFEGAGGGEGTVDLPRFLSFRDPDHKVPFPIVNETTTERLLTGADFDIESVVRLRDGSFLVGEEFGPFVLHFDGTGKLLAAPVPLPGVQSPQHPGLAGARPTLPASKGFEAMAFDGSRYAYPVLEGALVDEPDQRVREIHQLDTRTMRYTGRTWDYRTVEAANLVGDAFMVGRDRMLVLERDNFGGAQAVTKRVVEVDLGRTEPGGHLVAEPVLDLLEIANPDGIGAGDGYGTGDPFSFPFVSDETIVQLRDGSFVLTNDNNFPGDDARVDGEPDDIEIIHVDLRRQRVRDGGPVVFAHRGASGYRPEHTIAAYELAAQQCADFVEPDLVMTKDGVLVARHEPEIGGTTDVAARPEFAERRTTKQVDGRAVTGWFVEDFTLAELKTLRAEERLPQLRPGNTAWDGLYQVPTLDEVLTFARRTETCDGEPLGVIPEIKHSTYLAEAGLPAERPLLEALHRNGVRPGDTPVVIQSFEVSNLRALGPMTRFELVQLVDCSGAPYDQVAAGTGVTYADLVTRRGMRTVARYADSVGMCKDVMIPRLPDGRLGRPTDAIDNAHEAGLTVTGWTFRRENSFLPLQFRSSTDPAAPGDLAGEIRAFLRAGMDDVFTDNPDVGAEVAADRGDRARRSS